MLMQDDEEIIMLVVGVMKWADVWEGGLGGRKASHHRLASSSARVDDQV